jgi:trans-2-enoyl-CoA reductase
MLRCGRRLLSTAAEGGQAAVYRQHGEPSAVLRVEPLPPPPPLGPGEVLVRWLAAPVNPSDINQIQGTYKLLPPLPAVGGNEGVGEVAALGADVRSLVLGQRVLAQAGAGTWRTHGVHAADQLQACPPGLDVVSAATLSVNPLTALRLLSDDFVQLRPGDVVALNAANSGVGRAALQLARARGLRALAVVRDRPGFEALEEELRSLGAEAVLKQGAVRRGRKDGGVGLPPARLALNAVGGEAAGELASLLGQAGTLVTYGGMGRAPLQLSTSSFIFRDLRARGFWLTDWIRRVGAAERAAALEECAAAVRSGALRPPPLREVRLPDLLAALEGATRPAGPGEHVKLLLRL